MLCVELKNGELRMKVLDATEKVLGTLFLVLLILLGLLIYAGHRAAVSEEESNTNALEKAYRDGFDKGVTCGVFASVELLQEETSAELSLSAIRKRAEEMESSE